MNSIYFIFVWFVHFVPLSSLKFSVNRTGTTAVIVFESENETLSKLKIPLSGQQNYYTSTEDSTENVEEFIKKKLHELRKQLKNTSTGESSDYRQFWTFISTVAVILTFVIGIISVILISITTLQVGQARHIGGFH